MTKRTKFQREKDLEEISRRYLHMETQVSIGEALGLTQQTVSNDIKAIQKRWLASSLSNLSERKAKELAKVDALELEYWSAWTRSQDNAEQVVTEDQGVVTKEDENKGEKFVGKRIKQTVRVEGQYGDPRFLQGIQWCITKRCELLGLDAPVAMDLNLFDMKGWAENRKERLQRVSEMGDE